VISSWLFAPALTWWFGIHHGLGAAGGWLALTIDMVFGAGFVAVRMWRGSWRSAALAARARMLVKLEVSPSLSG
jgi:Na+-driven multidrug efflux pump